VRGAAAATVLRAVRCESSEWLCKKGIYATFQGHSAAWYFHCSPALHFASLADRGPCRRYANPPRLDAPLYQGRGSRSWRRRCQNKARKPTRKLRTPSSGVHTRCSSLLPRRPQRLWPRTIARRRGRRLRCAAHMISARAAAHAAPSRATEMSPSAPNRCPIRRTTTGIRMSHCGRAQTERGGHRAGRAALSKGSIGARGSPGKASHAWRLE
jgi:hypothetical protein